MPKHRQEEEPVNAPGSAAEDSEQSAIATVPVEPKKKQRTESPEATALRMHRNGRHIAEKTAAEVARHAKRIGELNAETKAHQAECEALSPEAKRLLANLIGGSP